MTVRHYRSGSFAGLCLILWMGLVPASVFAQANPSVLATAEQLQIRAAELERAGKWNDALQIWCKIFGQDRLNEEANKHIQICLRRMLQSQRQLDLSLREKVLSLTHSQAIALYAEVLGTLQAAYIDREKVSPNRLLQQGAEEFLLSLNEPNFRKLHLPDVRDQEITEFQTRLRNFMAVNVVENVADAVTLVKQITTTVRRDLRITRSSVVILEFISGACNSLDEYSSFLSPAELIAETRPDMEASVVEAGFLKEGVGYFRVTHFRDSTPAEIDAAIASLKMSMDGMNLKALVMDLRGNSGGSFSAAVQVVERFLPEGVVVTTQGRLDEFNKVHQTGGRMNVISLPLIVLVDATTASAAEILAGAFRDHQRATLVGTSTYGKGSIQHVLQFQTAEEIDDSGKPKPRTGGMRITLARFYSPNGQAISGAGIAPHIIEQDKTRQLEVAVAQASRQISVMPPR